MLHLSLLDLPKQDSRWTNLTPYQAHQLVWKAFPRDQERPFLYHLQEHADRFGLLVQSTRPPDWSAMPGVEVRLRVIDPRRVEPGDEYAFSLRANPTVQREGYGDGKRRRVAVSANVDLRKQRARARGLDVEEEAFDRETTLLAWLSRRGERGGFALCGSLAQGEDRVCHVGPTVTHRIHRTRNGHRPRPGTHPITIHGCDFTGRLRVTDPDAFAHLRRQGVGRAKAFGFGLLMVIPK